MLGACKPPDGFEPSTGIGTANGDSSDRRHVRIQRPKVVRNGLRPMPVSSPLLRRLWVPVAQKPNHAPPPSETGSHELTPHDGCTNRNTVSVDTLRTAEIKRDLHDHGQAG